MNDPILEKMQAVPWLYADKDPRAYAEIKRRVEVAGRQTKMLRYSELANGVEFHLPSIRAGNAYMINTWEWTGLDRRIIGEFLGYLSMESWRDAGFMASALVISGEEYQPSDQFFLWMKELGVLPDTRPEAVMQFWSEQVRLAFAHYRRISP